MSIKPLNKIIKKDRCVPEPLGCHVSEKPWLMLMVAKPGSGKSVLVANLLRLPQFYFRKFNKVFIASSNIENGEIIDPAYDKIEFDDENMYDDFNTSIFEDIRDKIKKDEDFKDNQYLLVIDDLALTLKDKGVQKQLARHRHLHLSIIITCQRLKMVPPLVRNIITHVAIFKTLNKQELEYLNEVVNIDKDAFQELIEYATRDKFNFLFIDVERLKFYKNFNEELILEK